MSKVAFDELMPAPFSMCTLMYVLPFAAYLIKGLAASSVPAFLLSHHLHPISTSEYALASKLRIHCSMLRLGVDKLFSVSSDRANAPNLLVIRGTVLKSVVCWSLRLEKEI